MLYYKCKINKKKEVDRMKKVFIFNYRGQEVTLSYAKLVKSMAYVASIGNKVPLYQTDINEQAEGHPPFQITTLSRLIERNTLAYHANPSLYHQAVKDAIRLGQYNVSVKSRRHKVMKNGKRVVDYADPKNELRYRVESYKQMKKKERFKKYVANRLYPNGKGSELDVKGVTHIHVKEIELYAYFKVNRTVMRQVTNKVVEEYSNNYSHDTWRVGRICDKVNYSSYRNDQKANEREERLLQKRTDIEKKKFYTVHNLTRQIDKKFNKLTTKDVKKLAFPMATSNELNLKVVSTNRAKTTLASLYQEEANLSGVAIDNVSSFVKLVNSGYVRSFVIDEYSERNHELIAPEEGGSCHSLDGSYWYTPELLLNNGFKAIIIEFKKGWLRLYCYQDYPGSEIYFSDVYGFSKNYNNIYSGSKFMLKFILQDVLQATLQDSWLECEVSDEVDEKVYINNFGYAINGNKKRTVKLGGEDEELYFYCPIHEEYVDVEDGYFTIYDLVTSLHYLPNYKEATEIVESHFKLHALSEDDKISSQYLSNIIVIFDDCIIDEMVDDAHEEVISYEI